MTGVQIGNMYQFSNIPEGEPVDILVLKNEYSSISFSKTEAIASQKVHSINQFSKLTLEDLESELQALD